MPERARAWFALSLLLACVPAGALQPAELAAGFGRGALLLETGLGQCRILDILLADTPGQQARGLMYVRSLEPDEGMLFRYPRPALISMWMKNTYVPLDMLFIDETGRVARVARDTVPLSTERIRSGEAVTWVLEVNAGYTRRWQIDGGERAWLLHGGP